MLFPKVMLLIVVMAGGQQQEVHIVPFESMQECKDVEFKPIDHAGDGAFGQCYYTADGFRNGETY